MNSYYWQLVVNRGALRDQLIDQARLEAIERLKNNADKIGANAVTMMRFDSNEANGIMSVVAYGTAVKVSEL